jgi:hypothetical protein
MSLLKALFYVTGAIFFVVMIVALFLVVYKVWYTTSTIKKVLLGGPLDDLITQLKLGLTPSLRSLGIIP